MSTFDHIHPIDTLIGKTILSRATGNKLGKVTDLIVDPIKGVLLGLAVQTTEGHMRVLDYHEIFSFGKDAVMVNADHSITPLEDSPLVGPPLAKKDLSRAQIITEGGNLLGHVSNIFLHYGAPPLVIYEIRESVLDRLLGRALFIPASAGRALSDNAERIVVPDEAAAHAADSLEALAAHYVAPLAEEETAIAARVRDKASPNSFQGGEVAETTAAPVICKQTGVAEEIVTGREIKGGEAMRDTARRPEPDAGPTGPSRDPEGEPS